MRPHEVLRAIPGLADPLPGRLDAPPFVHRLMGALHDDSVGAAYNRLVASSMEAYGLRGSFLDRLYALRGEGDSFHHDWTTDERLFVLGILHYHGGGWRMPHDMPAGFLGLVLLTVPRVSIREGLTFLTLERLYDLLNYKDYSRDVSQAELRWAAEKGDYEAYRRLPYGDHELNVTYLLERETTSADCQRILLSLANGGHPALKSWKWKPAELPVPEEIGRILGWRHEKGFYFDQQERRFSIAFKPGSSELILTQHFPCILGTPDRVYHGPLMDTLVDGLLGRVTIVQLRYQDDSTSLYDRRVYDIEFDLRRWSPIRELESNHATKARLDVLQSSLEALGFCSFDGSSTPTCGDVHDGMRRYTLREINPGELLLRLGRRERPPRAGEYRRAFANRFASCSPYPSWGSEWDSLTIESDGSRVIVITKDSNGLPIIQGPEEDVAEIPANEPALDRPYDGIPPSALAPVRNLKSVRPLHLPHAIHHVGGLMDTHLLRVGLARAGAIRVHLYGPGVSTDDPRYALWFLDRLKGLTGLQGIVRVYDIVNDPFYDEYYPTLERADEMELHWGDPDGDFTKLSTPEAHLVLAFHTYQGSIRDVLERTLVPGGLALLQREIGIVPDRPDARDVARRVQLLSLNQEYDPAAFEILWFDMTAVVETPHTRGIQGEQVSALLRKKPR